MTDCKPILTPPTIFHNSRNYEHNPLSSSAITSYRNILGASQYLTITRPDLTFSVKLLSQFMHSPSIVYEEVIKRVLRYVKVSHSFEIRVLSQSSLNFYGFSNTDWAGYLNTR